MSFVFSVLLPWRPLSVPLYWPFPVYRATPHPKVTLPYSIKKIGQTVRVNTSEIRCVQENYKRRPTHKVLKIFLNKTLIISVSFNVFIISPGNVKY